MKRNKLYTFALAAGLVMAGTSCSDDEITNNNGVVEEGPEVEFTVKLPGSEMTRALINDDTQSEDWNDIPDSDPRKQFPVKTEFEAEQDALYIFEDGIIGERGTFTALEDGVSTSFRGRFKGAPTKTSIIALYPSGSYGAAAKKIAGETYFNMEGQTQVGNNTTDHLKPYLYMTGESTLSISTDGAVTVNPISLHHETVLYKFVFTLPNGTKFNNALDFSKKENRIELALLGNTQTYSQRQVNQRTHRTGSGETLNRVTDHSQILPGDEFRRQILDLRAIEQSKDNTYTFYMLGLPTVASAGDIMEVVLVMGDDAYISRTLLNSKTYFEAGNLYTIKREFSGTPAGASGTGSFVKASVFNTYISELQPSSALGEYESGHAITNATELRALVYALQTGSTGGFLGIGDEDTAGKQFYLRTSIHVTAKDWYPIGGWLYSNDLRKRTFRGRLDGGNASGNLHGYAISGELRNINTDDRDKTEFRENFGFFGATYFGAMNNGSNHCIENFLLTASVITANSNNVGGIVGLFHHDSGSLNIRKAQVKNSYFYGNIDARCNNAATNLYIGAVIGRAQTSGAFLDYPVLFDTNHIKPGYIIGRAPGAIYFGGVAGHLSRNYTADNTGTLREPFIDLHSSGGKSVSRAKVVAEGTPDSGNVIDFVEPVTP